jgi:hypothetical protein
MAHTNKPKRNFSEQIISNTDDNYDEVIISGDTTAFEIEDYNRTLDRLSDELLVDVADTTPRIVSSNFVDTGLIITADIANRINLTLGGSGDRFSHDNKWTDSNTANIRYLTKVAITQDIWYTDGNDHALNYKNVGTGVETDVYYTGSLQRGTTIFNSTTNEPIVPFYPWTSYYMIKTYDENTTTETSNTDTLDNFIVGSDGSLPANPRFLQQVHDDRLNNSKETWDTIAYHNIPFTGCILGVGGNNYANQGLVGKAVSLHKVVGEYILHFSGHVSYGGGSLDVLSMGNF